MTQFSTLAVSIAHGLIQDLDLHCSIHLVIKAL